jgi:exopolyphosphatase/pppGpp-phosphohydrolase
MKLTEIRQQGYQALINALGVAGTLRFLQQLDVGYGDYTTERHQWLEQLTIDDFRNFVKQKQPNKPE